jgi:hypothetical protein
LTDLKRFTTPMAPVIGLHVALPWLLSGSSSCRDSRLFGNDVPLSIPDFACARPLVGVYEFALTVSPPDRVVTKETFMGSDDNRLTKKVRRRRRQRKLKDRVKRRAEAVRQERASR